MYIKDQNTDEIITSESLVTNSQNNYTVTKDNCVVAFDDIDGIHIDVQAINCRVFVWSNCNIIVWDYCTVSGKTGTVVTHGIECKIKNLDTLTIENLTTSWTFNL